MLSQTAELDEKGIPPPHSPPLSPRDQRHLVLLLNCYPHFLDQSYVPEQIIYSQSNQPTNNDFMLFDPG